MGAQFEIHAVAIWPALMRASPTGVSCRSHRERLLLQLKSLKNFLVAWKAVKRFYKWIVEYSKVPPWWMELERESWKPEKIPAQYQGCYPLQHLEWCELSYPSIHWVAVEHWQWLETISILCFRNYFVCYTSARWLFLHTAYKYEVEQIHKLQMSRRLVLAVDWTC